MQLRISDFGLWISDNKLEIRNPQSAIRNALDPWTLDR